MPQCRSTRWRTDGTSCCAAAGRRCSRTSCRGTDMHATPILHETPSQTAGPYVHIGLIPRQAGFAIFENDFGNVLAGSSAAGERIRIEGRVLDGLGAPCRDVLLQIWQATAPGPTTRPPYP